jgi:hypothetical protein
MLSPEAERRHRGARLAVAIALTPVVYLTARHAADEWRALVSEVRSTRELVAAGLALQRVKPPQRPPLRVVTDVPLDGHYVGPTKIADQFGDQ